MACALSLFCWHWINLCRLGSEQFNIYYVTSSNAVKLCDFKQCYLVRFLWSCLCHLWYTKSQYSEPCLVYPDLCTFVLLVLIFSSQSEQRKTVLCLFLGLIDKSSLVFYFFTIKTHTVMFYASCTRLRRLSQVNYRELK